jgi:hypothetical protein
LTTSKWEPRGWSAVEQLHRARNDAQHAAVVAAPEQIPVWSDAAWAFIDSLCKAAFSVPLAEIVLADAVRDPELRTCLRWSEEALQVERGRSSLLTLEAFDRARDRWREQQGLLGFASTPVGPLLGPDPLQGVQGKFRQLDSLLEIQRFASDIGEYFWLRRARHEFESARWPPDEQDERRALLFVVNWIVRWEIFDRGYPDDRWTAHRDTVAPPVADDEPPAAILGAHAELLNEVAGQGARRVAMYFQLVNVPARGRAPWSAFLQEAMSDSARDAESPGMFLQVAWDIAGVLEVQVALGNDPLLVGATVRRALQRAVTRYEESVTESEQREQDRVGIEAAFREIVLSARGDLPFFQDVTVQTDNWLGTAGLIVFVHLNEAVATGEEIAHAVDSFRDAARMLPKIHLRDGCIAFEACEINEETQRGIHAAVKRTEDQVHHVREIRARQGMDYGKFAASLREQFGDLPRHIVALPTPS